jgi:hypothetical protein
MWHPDTPEAFRDQAVLGDCRELGRQMPDESIDLIFTDPPYTKSDLHLYDWLFPWATRVLRPSGFLIAYVGGYYQDAVMAKARKSSLSFFWQFTYVNGGSDSSIVWERMIIARGKVLLCYRKRKSRAKPRTLVLGVWAGSGEDKRYHAWGQDASTARYYVDCFSQPNDIIADPFVGGGTTPYVCRVLDRHFVCFDSSPTAIATTQERLKTIQPLLFGWIEASGQLPLGLDGDGHRPCQEMAEKTEVGAGV